MKKISLMVSKINTEEMTALRQWSVKLDSKVIED